MKPQGTTEWGVQILQPGTVFGGKGDWQYLRVNKFVENENGCWQDALTVTVCDAADPFTYFATEEEARHWMEAVRAFSELPAEHFRLERFHWPQDYNE